MPLDSRPARTDLTDREIAKILAGFIGGMLEMSDIEAVRNAIRWWAQTDAAWELLKQSKAIHEKVFNQGFGPPHI